MLSAESKHLIDPLPYRVDFQNGEACTGGAYTIPRFRGKGIMTYGDCKRLKCASERGITMFRYSVDTDNSASQAVHAKFHPKIYAKGTMLRILGLTFWREVGLSS
jgi:hypothetical protein